MITDKETKVISVHIEKTAGTSLESVLIKYFGRDQVLLWKPNLNGFKRSGSVSVIRSMRYYELIRMMFEQTMFAPALHRIMGNFLSANDSKAVSTDQLRWVEWKVIHGHFLASQFDEIIPDAYKIIVLREPLKRMISHYKYWSRIGGSITHRNFLSFDPTIGFLDFCFLSALQNFQTKALGDNRLDKDFNLVGTTDNLDHFLHFLLDDFGISTTNLNIPIHKKAPHSQLDSHIASVVSSPSFNERFYEFHKLDFENYRLANDMNK